MPWNSDGSFSLVNNFTLDRDLGPPHSLIDSEKVDAEFSNIKAGIENVLARDGRTLPTANINWGNKRILALGAATAATDAIRADQVASGAPSWVGALGGTADAITASAVLLGSTAPLGTLISGIVSTNNTGPATFALNSVGALPIKRIDGSDLKRSDLRTGRPVTLRKLETEWRIESPLNADVRGGPVFMLSASVSATPETPNVHIATAGTTFAGLEAGQCFLYTSHRITTDYLYLTITDGAGYTSDPFGVVDYRGQGYVGGEILNNATYLLYFNGTHFRVVASGVGGGGGGGSTTLSSLTDVDLGLTPADGDVLSYSGGLFVLRNIPLSIPSVASVNAKADTTYVDAQLATKLPAGSVSAFGASLIDDADAAAARTTLALGTMAIEAKATWDATIAGITAALGTKVSINNTSEIGRSLINAVNQAAMRDVLGLGTMATELKATWDALLADITSTVGTKLDIAAASATYATIAAMNNKADAAATATALSGKLNASAVSVFGASLIDDVDAAAGRTTLGLGTMSTEAKATWDSTIAGINTTVATKLASDDAAATYATIATAGQKADLTYVNSQLANKLNSAAVSAFGATLIDDASSAAARTTLGLGTMATEAKATWDATINAINTTLASKADTAAINSALALKADADATTAALAGKLDAGATAVAATTATKWGGATKYVSTADPSGGVDGDIWFKRAT